jgi:hypothetical protein
MQYAMDNDGAILDLKIQAPVLGAKAIEFFPIALDETKFLAIQILEVAFLDVKLIEQFQLLHRAHLGHFGSTEFVEDNF